MHELNEGEIDLETSWRNFNYNAVRQNGGNDDDDIYIMMHVCHEK